MLFPCLTFIQLVHSRGIASYRSELTKSNPPSATTLKNKEKKLITLLFGNIHLKTWPC